MPEASQAKTQPKSRGSAAPVGVRALRTAFALGGLVSPEATGRAACWLFTRPQQQMMPPRERDWLTATRPVRVAGLTGIESGHGPLVVLLHGWGGRPSQFGAFLAPLAAPRYRAVSLSITAHCGSLGRTTDPVDAARALLTASTELGAASAVVAHSFGAAAAGIALARGLFTDKVVLLAAPASLEWVLDDFAARIDLPPRAARAFRRTAERRAGADPRSLSLSTLAPAMTVPALFLHDPADLHAPYARVVETAAAWPGSKLVPTPGTGHYRLLRDPAVVRTSIEWITDGRRPR